MKTALALSALSIGHHGRAIGEPVALDVQSGEIVCLLGPNGCGKTTLFRTVLGLLPRLGGNVDVNGHDPAATTREQLARAVAYVPQAHAGVFAYTADDVVLMGRAARVGPHSMPSATDRHAAAAALTRLGIEHLARRRYTEISGGERQLVLIARALAQDTPLIVMDEPTASLDFGNQRLVLREIERLADRGIAVLISTHQPEHAMRVAHRVALMRHGKPMLTGRSREVLTPRSVADLYSIEEAEVERSLCWMGRTHGARPADSP